MATERFPHLYLRWFITGIVATLCTGGFAWLVWSQVEKFINKKTSVTTDFAKSKLHQVPDIIFCSRNPFRDNATWQFYSTSADYESVLRPPQIEYLGEALSEYEDANHNIDGIEWIYVDSMYNGRCKQFKHKDKLATASYLTFAAMDGPDNPIDIFFMLEGDEVFLLWQNWGWSSMSYTSISSSAIISLHPEEYVLLENHEKSSMHCQGREPKSLTDCIWQVLHNRFTKYNCLPLQLKKLFLPAKQTCNLLQVNDTEVALKESSDILARVQDYCHIPCKTIKHQITNIPNHNIPGGPFYNPDGYYFFIFFPTDEIRVHEQYLIHDLTSIVSAVGGGLGLFLGFSCFSMASIATNSLFVSIFDKQQSF